MKNWNFWTNKIKSLFKKEIEGSCETKDSISIKREYRSNIACYLRRRINKEIRHDLLFFIALVAVACTRIFWFFGVNIIRGGDLVMPTNSLNFIRQRLYIWNEIDFGQLSTLLPRVISPIYFIMGSLNMLGVPTQLGQIFITILMYSLGSFVVYKLVKIFSPEGKQSTAAMFASFFYLFNPVLINDGIQTSIRFLPSYVILPSILYFYILSLKKGSLFNYFMDALLITLLASGIPSFRDLLIAVLLLGVYSIFYLVTTYKIKNYLIVIGQIFILSILLNMFWLFPFIVNSDRLSIILTHLISTPNIWKTHMYCGLCNVIRGFGKWSFFSSYQGSPYLAYSNYYTENLIVITSTFLLPLLIFSSILFSRKREILFMGCMALFFIFMSKGINPPFGEFYKYLVNNIPIFKATRESFYFFQALMIPYSYLFGYSCQVIFHRSLNCVRKKLKGFSLAKSEIIVKAALISFLLSPLIITSWPLVTGDVITQWHDPNWRGVDFPDSYNEISDVLVMNSPTRVLALPYTSTYVLYDWGYSGGRNILQYELPIPLVFGRPGDEYYSGNSKDFVQYIYNLVEEREYETFSKILGIAGVEFIIVETGLASKLGEEALNYVFDLANSPYFTIIQESAELVLFKVENSYPQVYVPQKIMTYHGTNIVFSNEIMTQRNLRDGWIGNSIVEIEYNGTSTNLVSLANGSYTVCLKEIKLPLKGIERGTYIIIPFSTSPEASISVAIGKETKVDQYLSSMNPPPNYVRNSYSSGSFYNLIYRIQEEILDAVSLKIFATNFMDKEYFGNLSFSIGPISMVREIGSLTDSLNKIELDQLERCALIDLDINYEFTNEVKRSANYVTKFEFFKKDPTRYVVNVNTTEPLVLVISQTFDKEWKARIGTETVKKHFIINGFANAWIIEKTGSFQITLFYSAQRDAELGRLLSLFILTFLSCLIIIGKIKPLTLFKKKGGQE